MSASEHEFSEGSNYGSPQSMMDSPYSSPSQQVPHLTTVLSGISCEEVYMHADGRHRPFLRIVEQPQNYFRFRYKSEMVGTHGCLLGKSTSASKSKTHPTVELVNYTGKALIRCRLSQADKDDEHPHKLFEDEQEDRDVSTIVPQQGSYKVGFAGMGIIHTAKKDVPGLLFKKYMERLKNPNMKDLRTHCENTAKSINLNIVRLRFSAHDITTDNEICPPVFSEPIHNMKSAAVNDLKICRISRLYGRPRGGDDVFILVEKVNKKNIMIRFYEVNENGDEVWSTTANFLLSDVHHQYAIVFRTPPYKDLQITKDVKVCIELMRPSDGRTSEPKEFTYRADQVFKNNKRKRGNSSYSSLESSSSGSIKNEVPVPVEMMNHYNDRMDMSNLYQIHVPQLPQLTPMAQPVGSDLAHALYSYNVGEDAAPSAITSPMLGQTNIPEPPVIHFTSSELERLIRVDTHIPSEEVRIFCDNNLTEYFNSFGENLTDKPGSMDFIRSSIRLVADGRVSVKKEPISPTKGSASADENRKLKADKSKANEYNEFYKAEDGNEVKKLVKDICDLIKNKQGYKKYVISNKLERLFELRLSNGDTFLHMTLSSNQPSFEFIIRLIHSMKMTHLLNLANDMQQTILHVAVNNDMPKLVGFLVAKGCDPMLGDKVGNNVVHYAAVCQTCLEPLLDAIKSNNVHCDLNAYNLEKRTALHMAAEYDCETSARLLLRHGASYNARDSEGRTPLHLAALDDYLSVTRALLERVPPGDIDVTDGRGNTALQIVCSAALRENSIEIVKLLLQKKADPLKHEEHKEPAWRLALNKPQLWDVMRHYVPSHAMVEDDIKSEPEDDFESADEGESADSGLSELPLYLSEVAALLDASGAWRQLAVRLRMDSLLSWYGNTHSPARTLLTHIKETGDQVTSKSLAMYLQDMGQSAAANVIRRYISE